MEYIACFDVRSSRHCTQLCTFLTTECRLQGEQKCLDGGLERAAHFRVAMRLQRIYLWRCLLLLFVLFEPETFPPRLRQWD